MSAPAAVTVALRRWPVLLCLLALIACAMPAAAAAQEATTSESATVAAIKKKLRSKRAIKRACRKKARRAARRSGAGRARTRAARQRQARRRTRCVRKARKRQARLRKAMQAARRKHAALPPVTTQYGLNAGQLWLLSDPQLTITLGLLRSHGITTIRHDISWDHTESQPGTFDWSRTDRVVGALAHSGIRLYPLLAYSAKWAAQSQGDIMSRPADFARYAAFAAAVAQRYGPNGTFWAENPSVPPHPVTTYEIWNEPNFARFWRETQRAPEDFAELTVAAREAIVAHHPEARIVTGGLVEFGATPAPQFINRMYRHRPQLADQIAGVGFHPYNRRAEWMLATIAEVRRAIDRHDPDATIELTEAGFSTIDVPEAQRVIEFPALVKGIQAQRLRVGSLHPYVAMSSEGDPAIWEQWFGILNRDGTAKPSGLAYLTAVREATL